MDWTVGFARTRRGSPIGHLCRLFLIVTIYALCPLTMCHEMRADDVALARCYTHRDSRLPPYRNLRLRRLKCVQMKTNIVKSLLNTVPAILFAVALMQSYRSHMELKYNY